VGSPLFMSPEQCMGNHLDIRSDVYSIGCVMYNTITGHLPFMGQNAVQTIFKQLNEMPVRPKNLRPDVPDSIEMLIFKSIQKDPAGRYSSMDEIQHELMRIKSVLYGELV
jgi:serine/threonine-protein kinase